LNDPQTIPPAPEFEFEDISRFFLNFAGGSNQIKWDAQLSTIISMTDVTIVTYCHDTHYGDEILLQICSLLSERFQFCVPCIGFRFMYDEQYLTDVGDATDISSWIKVVHSTGKFWVGLHD
jgi:hypothetical protein